MQAELEAVSSLLQQAAKSFESNTEDVGCTRLSEASSILENVLSEVTAQSKPARERATSVAA